VASAPVGLVLNPASGKDIRRLVAHASVFDNREKQSIARRAVIGAMAAGAGTFLYMPDRSRIVEEMVDRLDAWDRFRAVETPDTGSALDTTRAAQRLDEAGCGAVITLGGDGTNRAFVKGWRSAPLIAVSTGTNNVFPEMIEGTLAGLAAGLVASGRIALEDASHVAKRVRVETNERPEDSALIDAALLSERFVASRAIWAPEVIRTIVLARAEPAAVGLSAIGGLLQPVSTREDCGLLVRTGEGSGSVQAPIAPGLFAQVGLAEVRRLPLGEPVEVCGPGVLALDGEREIALRPGQKARLSVVRDGPRVIDVQRVLALAACHGVFRNNLLNEAGDGN
jgi:predicted polyphosphate/ATP-dependent NAD kinase